MKKYFENPTIELVEFETEDVITVSGLILDGGTSGAPKTVDYSSISSIFLGL
jgi:hypothetical protein